MAKKNLTVEQAQDSLNELMLTGESNSGVSFDEAFEILEKADSSKMSELTSEYFVPKHNSTYNLLFEGMQKATLDGKEVDVAVLRNKEGLKMINANAIVVNSLKNVTVLPAFVRIVTREEKKGANGTYLDMSVLTLPSATK